MGGIHFNFQLSVGVFDTCLVWYLLVLPSYTHAVTNMTSLMATIATTHMNPSHRKVST